MSHTVTTSVTNTVTTIVSHGPPTRPVPSYLNHPPRLFVHNSPSVPREAVE